VIDPREDPAPSDLDAAVDFVGNPQTAEFALRSLGKGGRYMIVCMFGGALELPLPLLTLRAQSLTGSFVGALAEMRELVALARAAG